MFNKIRSRLSGASGKDQDSSHFDLSSRLARSDMALRTELSPAPFFRNFPGMRDSKISQRYSEFFFKARSHGLADVEQLVPYIDVPMAPTMAEAHCEEADDEAGAKALLAEFPPHTWGYYLPLSRNYSTLGAKSDLQGGRALSRRRSEYRLNFIYRGLEAVLGQAPGAGLGARSLVDIACNWGGFSIEAGLRGAGEVMGFDIRPENVAKAKRVAAHFHADEIDFRVQDLFAYPVDRTYDIVLNLGLMYHISMPFEMMKKTYEMTGEIAVIDTIVHRESFSGFVLGTGEAAVGHAATAIGVELHPTYRGLIDLAYMVGFKDVVELRGLPAADWPGFDKEPYGSGTRRCIVCIK